MRVSLTRGGKSVTELENKKPDSDELIRNYILNGLRDAKSAAIKAGYSPKTAEQSASRVLRSVKAKEAIDAYRKVELQSYVWDKTEKLKKLEQIAENSMLKDDDQKMINASAAIAAIKTHNEMQGDNAPIETNNNIKVSSTLAARLTGGSKR